MVKKKVSFGTPPRAATPIGISTLQDSPPSQRVTRAAERKLKPPISPKKAEAAPRLSKQRHETPPLDSARLKKKPRLVSPKPERPLYGFPITFDTNGIPGQPPSPFVAENGAGSRLPVTEVTRRRVRPGPSKTVRRFVPATLSRRSKRLEEKTPLSAKLTRKAATTTTFRYGAPPPPALLMDRRAPRNRPEAIALEARQKALARVARPKSTPYPK
jgi:hypothetical protein